MAVIQNSSLHVLETEAVPPIPESGLARFLRPLRFLREGGHRSAQASLTVFMYHGILAQQSSLQDWCFLPLNAFREQMQFLRTRFDVLPLEEAFERLRAGTLKRPTAVVTFDDGYQNNYDLAFPILKEHGFPATIFLCTDLVDSGETLWFCRLLDACHQTDAKRVVWGGRQFSLKNPKAVAKTTALLQVELKRLRRLELSMALRDLSNQIGYDLKQSIGPQSPFRILDHASIKAMHASGLIQFGAHTRSHTILTRLDSAAQVREITGSIHDVERLVPGRCRTFAYPNGSAADFDGNCLRTLERAGVRVACTAIRHRNTAKTPPLELGRVGVGASTSLGGYAALSESSQ